MVSSLFVQAFRKSIPQLKTITEKSEQMVEVQNIYYRKPNFTMIALHLPKVKSAFMSTQSNLHSDKEAVYTEWANGLDVISFRTDIMNWLQKNCDPYYFSIQDEYMKSKFDYHISYYDPAVHLNNFFKYGINEGRWYSDNEKMFYERIDHYIKAFDKFSPVDLALVEDGIEDWSELIKKYSNFKVLRHSAVSGYPDYDPQDVPYILKNYYRAAHATPKGFLTMYSRRHGITRKETKFSIILKEKDRHVDGDEFDNKVQGTPATETFILSKPAFTPYYRPWLGVFQDLDERVLKAILEGKFGFTTDQSEFDIVHDDKLVTTTGTKLINQFPERHQKPLFKVLKAGYQDPLIILNAFYGIKLGRTKSSSGVSLTPFIETLNNMAAHDTALENQGVDTEFSLTQIDDTLYICDKEVDLDGMESFMFKNFGFKMNASKTETLSKGGLVYLQNFVGVVFNNELPTLTGLLWRQLTPEQFVGVLGIIARRLHRFVFKERLRQVAGDVKITVDDDDEFKEGKDAPVHFVRCVATIASIGPWLPEELALIFYKHMHLTNFKILNIKYQTHLKKSFPERYGSLDGDTVLNLLDECVYWSKRKLNIKVEEYGFDPSFLINDLAQRY